MPNTAARALHGLPEPLPPLALTAVHDRVLSMARPFVAGIFDWRHVNYLSASWVARTIQPRGDRRSRDEYEHAETGKIIASFNARVAEIETMAGDAVRKHIRPLIAIRAPRSVLIATARATSALHHYDGFAFLTDRTIEAIVADEVKTAMSVSPPPRTVAIPPRSTSAAGGQETYSRRNRASGISHHAG